MHQSRYFWTVLFVALAILGGGWIIYSQDPGRGDSDLSGQTQAPIAGHLAPEFTLADVVGDQISLGDFYGKPVVLNFWASWCPPCRAEMPHFQEASVKYNGLAVVLGVDQGEPPSIVSDFGAVMGISYPLLIDQDSSVNKQYNVVALPTTFFIDGEGIVREVYTGIVNGAVLEDRIERLLADGP